MGPISDDIKELPNGEVVISGLTEMSLGNINQATDLINKALNLRRVRSTNSNEFSSRSHCVFNLILVQRNLKKDSEIRMTKLRIVDLAGSEKFVKSYRETKEEEKKRINELI